MVKIAFAVAGIADPVEIGVPLILVEHIGAVVAHVANTISVCIRFYMESYLMNKLQAIAQAMALLNKKSRLRQGSKEYKIVKRVVADKIDRFGPEGALDDIKRNMTHLLDQIYKISK